MTSFLLFNGKNTILILLVLTIAESIVSPIIEGFSWLHIIPNSLGLIVILLYRQQSKKET